MIQFISSWIQGIAIAVIIVSIFELILPNGNIKKYIKVILGIYVIFNIISPFVDSKALYSLKLEDEIDNYIQKYEENNLSNEKKENIQDADKIYKSTLEKQIIQTVEAQGYIIYKCNVDGIFDADKKGAGIKSIQIILEGKKENNEYKEKAEEEKTETENDNYKNEINKIEEIEEVKINVEKQEKENIKDISEKDIKNLKKYLSEHYEIDKNIFKIDVR